MSDARLAGEGIDGIVERLGRWTATRTSRRSFLGRLGRAGVLVAGGATMATFLADQAEARVCGQSGVAPLCSTFTCDETWGWCWYASGCCAGGALKKICDCCAPNTPHPVGYCPSGTRVLCIVESCGADPRLMTKPVELLGTNDATALTVALSRRRFDAAPMAVVGDAESPALAAIAASLGRVADAPVLLVPRGRIPDAVHAELSRLGVEFAVVVGPHLPDSAAGELAARGIHVDRVGEADDPTALAAQVASWSRPLTGARSAVVVMGDALDVVGPAAALANARRMPLLLGDTAATHEALGHPRGVRRTWVVTREAANAERFPGGSPVAGGDERELALRLASLQVGMRGGRPEPTTLAARGAHLAAAAMATVPASVLVHEPGSLDGPRRWLLVHRTHLDGALVAGDRGAFPARAEYDLQALLNEFETHLLTGRGGEGLPVIPQPREERPIGMARR